jgi:hypothetical protein
VATLNEHARRGDTLAWLQDLSAMANAIWSHRRTLALRPHGIYQSDAAIRGWLSSLPADAYVYDLRRHSTVRGWPYGVAGPSARWYRCGRLPVFAVAASPTEGWRIGRPDKTSPTYPVAALGLEIGPGGAPTSRRRPRFRPTHSQRVRSPRESRGRFSNPSAGTVLSSAQCRSRPRVVAAASR